VDEPKVQVVLAAGAIMPEYLTEGSAGADLRARLDSSLSILPGCRALVEC